MWNNHYQTRPIGGLHEVPEMGYGEAPPAAGPMGYYGQYPEPGVQGYVRETEAPFNPRGIFVNQLGGYVREKIGNPTCGLTRPAEVEMPPTFPSFFKPHF